MTRIILIGYMGAGKTTIGKVLAREMGLEFYDLDNYIEDRFHQILDTFHRQIYLKPRYFFHFGIFHIFLKLLVPFF